MNQFSQTESIKSLILWTTENAEVGTYEYIVEVRYEELKGVNFANL